MAMAKANSKLDEELRKLRGLSDNKLKSRGNNALLQLQQLRARTLEGDPGGACWSSTCQGFEVSGKCYR